MKLLKVFIEHQLMQLNNPFDYLYDSDKPIYKGVRVLVDFHGQKIIGFVSDVIDIDNSNNFPYQIKPILQLIDESPLINEELFELAYWMSKNTISPIISCLNAMLPPSLKPKSNFKNKVMVNYVNVVDYQLKEKYPGLYLIKDFKAIVGQYKYNKYKKDGLIEIVEKEKKADVSELVIKPSDLTLTHQQAEAINLIEKTDKQVILLHGLTGSGKTEVFLRICQKVLLEGKQVLVLVPEISLTTMMVKRFKERFNSIAIYTSALSSQEKYEQYCLVKENKVKIVVGTRSAVFMPFTNLGLIVMDEEHDNSYKQDNTPRYNTKDIAIQRVKYHNCKLLLASATPTLESYARAIKNVYQLVSLTERINKTMPIAHLVDMSKQIRQGDYIISKPLKQAIGQRLANNQQVILLLNRRGYNPIVKCSNCSEVVRCPHCDIALSYHKDENRLVCHVCGYSTLFDISCKKCGSKMWTNYGVGTQRLSEEISKLYPDSKIVRMDTDTTRNKNSHQQILMDFENHKYDIMVGTQMIAKGLDFPNVTLVGIFNADGPLARNDYRSVETTFDLIVQASGRSGRSDKQGEVFIQAYDVNHYGIRLAVKQDYIAFFNNEMSYRHALKYPPYSYLVAICFLSEDESLANENCNNCFDYFDNNKSFIVLGPSCLNKLRDQFRYRIVLKATDKEKMIEEVWKWYQSQQYNRNKLNIQIDVDPYILD